MKRILITGSAGFVGHHLCEHILANTDWEVVGIDSFRHRGDSLRLTGDPKRYKVFCHDLNSPISDRLKNQIGKIDYVMMLASESHVDRSISDPVPFITNNINLTLNTLEYCRQIQPEKIIQCSTDEVFGPASEGYAHHEWDTILPSNPYCLHPDTKIITPEGLKKITDINPQSDLVYARSNIRHGRFIAQTIDKLFTRKFKGKLLKIKTSNNEIICTPQHRFFENQTRFSHMENPHKKIIEIEAKQLKVNSRIMAARKISSREKIQKSNDLYRFLGYFVADGSYSKKSRYLRLADNKKDFLEFYKDILLKLIPISKNASTGNLGTIYKHGTKNCYYLQVASEILRSIVDLSDKNKITKSTLNVNLSAIENFIAGFFDGDGHLRYEGDLLVSAAAFQVDLEILENIQFLLRKSGILSFINEDKKGYKISITESKSLKKFIEKIPSLKVKKASTLRKSQSLKFSDNVSWERIQSIEELEYEGPVYDMEVPNGHNYLANYFCVHNSASKASQEAICFSYWRTYNMPIISTNCMNMIGERQDTEKFIPMCIKKIVNGETVKIHATPDKQKIGSRMYIHARNLADAWLFLLKNQIPARFGQAERLDKFNVVGELELNNLEVAQFIADTLDMPLKYELIDFHSSRNGHDLRYALDGTKLQNMGWKPPVPLKDSLKKMIFWTLKNKEWLK